MVPLRTPLIFAVLCCLAWAQSDRGTITGIVADQSGAVLTAAPIELRNAETGALYQAVTSGTGNYTIGQLPAGTYQMTVQAPGFKRYVQQNIRVQANVTVRIDVTLEVGSNTESITVTDQVSLLKTETGDTSHTIQAQKLNDLPVLGIGGNFSSSQGLRFYMAQAQLVPGTYFQVSAIGTATIKVNGAPTATQRTQIEGMDATNSLNGVPASMQPSVDAIEETTILVSDYAAEFGQVGGGIFNITMRSGTNQFHGSAYDYWQNEAFNAATPFVNAKSRVRRNDYGFSFGGPIWIPKAYNGRDRSFFFWNFEQYREFATINNAPITVPTLAYRNGDFSSIRTSAVISNPANCSGATCFTPDPLGNVVNVGTIYDPATTARAADGRLYRTAFPGNAIPVTRFDPVSVRIQNLIPLPDTTAAINNLTPVFPTDRVTDNYSLKLDHQISTNAKISGFGGTNQTRAQYSTNLNGSEGLPPTITATRGTFTRSYTWRINYDHSLTPTVLLHLGAGIVNYPFNDNAPVRDFDQVKELGLTGAPVNPGRFPSISGLTCATVCTGLGGMRNMGPGVGGAQTTSRELIPTFNTSLTWVKNNHTFKFGGEFRINSWTYQSLTSTMGVYAFSQAQTAQPYIGAVTVGTGFLGFPYASFLLGEVNQVTVRTPAAYRFAKQQWGFFAQDNWKITRKLTLDYGLRYDFSTAPREQYGRMPTLDPATPNAFAGGMPGATVFEATCKCKFVDAYPFAFGPRIGVAYQLLEKTVLRGGFGIVYGGTGNSQVAAGTVNPASVVNPPTFGEAAMQFRNGLPPAFIIPYPNLRSDLYPTAASPQQGVPIVVDSNGGRPSRQMQWSIGIQREIIRDLVVDASYVGNRGAWWPSTNLVNYNAISAERLAAYGLDLNNPADLTILNSFVNAPGAGRFRNQVPYTGFSPALRVSQSLRPYPQFNTGLTPLWAPLGQTLYDSFQLKVTKRFSHGLDFTYAYTFSKELQNGTGGDIFDVFNRRINKSLSTLSRPHASVLAVNYTTPNWGRNRIVRQLTGGWMLGAVLQYASGTPIAAPLAQNPISLANLVYQSANQTRVPGEPLFLKDLNCGCIDPNKDLVLNPKAWSDPPAGQWGRSAIYFNDYRTQRIPQENMSLARLFQFREGMTLMLRMEFSNIFNRTFLNAPSSTNPGIAVNCVLNSGANASGAACSDPAQLRRLTQGFGWINPNSVPVPGPRTGTGVIRFTF